MHIHRFQAMQIFPSLRDRILLDFDTIVAKHVKMVAIQACTSSLVRAAGIEPAWLEMEGDRNGALAAFLQEA